MQKIIELLEWYQQNSNNSLDDMVGIELVKLNSLYDMYENHTDEMFVEEMIESFCKIIEKQRAKIEELEAQAYAQNGAAQRGFSKVGGTANMAYIKSVVQEQEGQPIGEYTNDTQLQEDFVQFCMNCQY